MNILGINNEQSFKGIIVVKGNKNQLKRVTLLLLRTLEDGKKVALDDYQFKCADLRKGIRVFATKNESFGLRNFVLDAKDRGLERPSDALYEYFYANISRYVTKPPLEEIDAGAFLGEAAKSELDIHNLTFII